MLLPAILIAALYIPLVIVLFRRKHYGVILIVTGAVVLFLASLLRVVNGNFAANPGINWQSPDGSPLSDGYQAASNYCVPWQIGGAVVMAAGVVWTILRHVRRR